MEKIMEEKKRYFCPNCNERIDWEQELDYACSQHYKNASSGSEEQMVNDYGPDTGLVNSSESEKQKVKFKVGHYDGNMPPDCPKCKIKKNGRLTKDSKPFNSVLCPECGKPIPLLFFNPSIEVYRICFAGTRKSGKTCYKSSINTYLDNCDNGLNPLFLKYPKGDNIQIFEQGIELPNSTNSIISKEDWNLIPDYLGFETPDGRKILLIIYDIAGEDYQKLRGSEEDYINQWKNCITKSDAIFFLLDPQQSFVNHLESELSDDLGREQVETRETIKSVLTDINELKEIEKNIFKLPKIAYVYSKFDDPIIQAKFKEITDKFIKNKQNDEDQDLLWDNNGDLIEYKYSDGKIPDPSGLINEFTRVNDKRFIFTSSEKYGNFHQRGFVISALGIDSKVEEGKLVKIGTSFRVMDPVFWIINKGDE